MLLINSKLLTNETPILTVLMKTANDNIDDSYGPNK